MAASPFPIIVGSAPSSGSTLLVNIIGRIPGVFQTNELSIFDKVDWLEFSPDELLRKWPGMCKGGYRRRLACEMRPLFTGVDSPPPAPRQGDDYLSFIVRYMDEKTRSNGCRRWVEKTPSNVFAMHKIGLAEPNFRFVVITRDARACVTSLLKRGYSPVLSVARWYLSNLKANMLENEGRAFRISYEELVAEPRRTIKGLLDYLGEPFSERLLDAGQGEKPVASWSASPTDSIRPIAVWRDEKLLDPRAAAVFASMRITKDFAREIALPRDVPSPAELQELLGYPPVTSDVDVRKYNAGSVAMAHDVIRYWASLVANSHIPRKVPFTIF